MEIIEVRPQLHVVRVAFGQLYLWLDGDAVTVIDTGVPGSGPVIADAVRGLGLTPEAIRRIVVTHGHEDHYGSAAEVRSWHGAPVHAHAADAAVIRGDVPRAEPVLTDFDRPLWEQVSASLADLRAPPSEVDVELHDGDELDFGDGARVVGAPGHTPGSIGVYLPKHQVLFTGDTIAAGPDGVFLGVFNLDRAATMASFRRLADLDSAVACFGHGDPLTADAGRTLRAVEVT